MILLFIASCATQPTEIRQQPSVVSESEPTQPQADPIESATVAPPRTIHINGKALMLVRAMEGGVCNKSDQGALGIFLIYADPIGIKHIETTQEPNAFENFESSIQAFSLKAFQEAVNHTNIGGNPFALDYDDAKTSVTQEIIENFNAAIKQPLSNFENKHSLIINVVAFSHSFQLFSSDCQKTLTKSKSP